MIPENELRIIEVKKGREWVRARFDQLERGDVYRMREPHNNEIVVDDNGVTNWRVTQQARITADPMILKPITELYVDMDGVQADFYGMIRRLLGSEYMNFAPRVVWRKVEEIPNFFETLEPLPGLNELWEGIHALNIERVAVLTASPMPTKYLRTAPADKVAWISKHVVEPMTVIVTENWKEKSKYAHPCSVLIDDQQRNIDAWEEAGGIGILHMSVESTLQQLKTLIKERQT